MICSVCRKNDVRPPVACDGCGRLACRDCMEERWVSKLSPYGWKGKAVHRLICKVCRAEEALASDA